MERVSVRHGTHPVVLVAPHAYQGDDYNTDVIVDTIADRLNASSIINHGWQRSDDLDISQEKANCNNTSHLIDVVKDEFLNPLIRLVARTKKLNKRCLVVIIHGMSNYVRKIAGDSTLDMVLGYGDGSPNPSFTCTYGIKDYVMHALSRNSITVYEGKAKGRYSGYAKTNLNQFWRVHHLDYSVESFQLEIVRELREDTTISTLTAEYLADALDDAIENRYWKKPASFNPKQI